MPVHTSAQWAQGSRHTHSHTSMHTCHLAQGKPICRLDWAGKTQAWQSRSWRCRQRRSTHESFRWEAPLSTVQEAESAVISPPLRYEGLRRQAISSLSYKWGNRFRAVLSFARITLLAASRDDQLPPSLAGQGNKSHAPLSEADRSAFLGPWALSSCHLTSSASLFVLTW